MKRCSKCGVEKPPDGFGRNKSTSDGLSSYCRACRGVYEKEKRKTDDNYRLSRNLRDGVYGVIKRNYRSAFMRQLLGCSIREFKAHLESQFQAGMTWDNYGEWHVDHIVACSAFDLSCPIQQRLCFNFSNLQPLWARDNLVKGSLN